MKKKGDQAELIEFIKKSVSIFQKDFKSIITSLQKIAEQKDGSRVSADEVANLQASHKTLQEKVSILESRLNFLYEQFPSVVESAYKNGQPPETIGDLPGISPKDSDKDADGYESVIRLSIVELRDKNGLTFQEIADKFNAEGIKTFRKSSTKWYFQTIQKIYAQMKKIEQGIGDHP